MINRMKALKFEGIVYGPHRSDGGGLAYDAHMDEVAPEDEFDRLMSLALDDMLSVAEAARFEDMMTEQPAYSDAWDQWRLFDAALRSAPAVEPSRDFVASLELRLLKRQRSQRLWLGVGFGIVVLALWSSLVAGLVGAGAYVMLNQSNWIEATVRFAVLCSATAQSQAAMVLTTLNSALSAPQVQVVVLAYSAVGLAAIFLWARFLGRSLAEVSQTASISS